MTTEPADLPEVPEASGGVGTTTTVEDVTEALKDAFGLRAVPRKSVRCPMHDDTQPSLWILPDDRRAICYGSCSWTSPGVTANEIRAAGQGVGR